MSVTGYHYYDGAKFDVFSIVCTVIGSIAFILAVCGYFGMIFTKYDSKWKIIAGKVFYYAAVTFCVVGLAEGINLIVRFVNDECNYDPNEECKVGNGVNAGDTIKGNLCSSECTTLRDTGVAFICVAGICLTGLLVVKICCSKK